MNLWNNLIIIQALLMNIIIAHSHVGSGLDESHFPNQRITYFTINVSGTKLQIVVLEDKNGVITFGGRCSGHASLTSLFHPDNIAEYKDAGVLYVFTNMCNHFIHYIDMNNCVLMIPATLYSVGADEEGYPLEVNLKLTLNGVDFVFDCL